MRYLHMRNFLWFLVATGVLIAGYAVRESIIRPDKATILSWMNERTITVVPVADFKPPVVEQIDPAKVRDLKHESGDIFSWQLGLFGLPRYGFAIYTFRYPYRGEMNLYELDVKYRWWPRPGWFPSKPESISVSGPIDEVRLTALRKNSYSFLGQYSRSRR
jgi:hypothetical protein